MSVLMKEIAMRTLCLTVVLSLFAHAAQAATLSLSIIINSPPSTAITCTPIAPWTISGTSLSAAAAPVAAGSGICTLTIAPSGWSGALTLSGTNAASFALVGSQLNVGPSALMVGNYSIAVTSTP